MVARLGRAIFAVGITVCSPLRAEWALSDETDKISGRRVVVAEQLALSTTIKPHRQPEATSPAARLAIVCYGGQAWVTIGVPDVLMAGSTARVEYRFDSERPQASRSWRPSSSYAAIGLFETASTKRFLAAATKRDKLLFRSIDDSFGIVEAEFDVSKLAMAIVNVKRACSL
jgi:hypothetical protein